MAIGILTMMIKFVDFCLVLYFAIFRRGAT